MKRMHYLPALLLFAGVFTFCSFSDTSQHAENSEAKEVNVNTVKSQTPATPPKTEEPAIYPTKGWERASAWVQGMDGAMLLKANAEVKSVLPMVNAIFVTRHGYLIHEAYFNGFHKDSASRIYSVTKSVTGALIGMLIKDKKITGTDTKISKLMPDYFPPGIKGDARLLTVKHLLTMSSGFSWDERNLAQLSERVNNPQTFLSETLKYKPGSEFNYDDGNTALLSRLITRAAGKNASDMAAERLWKQLGISKPYWMPDNSGNSIGGYGLFMKAGDMAKFGYLFLRKGNWEGKQLIDSEYVNASISAQNKGGYPGNVAYGQLWWVDVIAGHKVSYALGYGGQFVAVIPDLDIVAVIVSDSRLNMDQINTPKSLLTNFIIPAVK